MSLEELEQQLATPATTDKAAGVRILAPTGEIGYIPAEQLEEAIADGARELTPDLMRQLRQETFMQHGIFKEKHEKTRPRKRRSIVISSRTRRRR